MSVVQLVAGKLMGPCEAVHEPWKYAWRGWNNSALRAVGGEQQSENLEQFALGVNFQGCHGFVRVQSVEMSYVKVRSSQYAPTATPQEHVGHV
jgi:hypothetical protein